MAESATQYHRDANNGGTVGMQSAQVLNMESERIRIWAEKQVFVTSPMDCRAA